MGRPKSRQAPRTTMSIRVSERERREIEEKAAATGMTPSAYIRTMALDGGNVDMTSHEDRQKLMYQPDSTNGKYECIYLKVRCAGGK